MRDAELKESLEYIFSRQPHGAWFDISIKRRWAADGSGFISQIEQLNESGSVVAIWNYPAKEWITNG